MFLSKVIVNLIQSYFMNIYFFSPQHVRPFDFRFLMSVLNKIAFEPKKILCCFSFIGYYILRKYPDY